MTEEEHKAAQKEERQSHLDGTVMEAITALLPDSAVSVVIAVEYDDGACAIVRMDRHEK